MRILIDQSYAEGYHEGIKWAENDRRDSIPSAHGAALLRSEVEAAVTDQQRWARAFYLGALRAYRSVTRTQVSGRWGQ